MMTSANTSPSSLYARLEQVVRSNPVGIALAEGTTRITYREILNRVDSLSGTFLQAGIKPGDRIAVILPNSANFVVTVFALWRCGGVLVPLHVKFQEDEILKYVADCGVSAVVTNARLATVVQSIQSNQAGVEHAWIFTENIPEPNYTHHPIVPAPKKNEAATPPVVEIDFPALSQYSTGSTGFSKRVTRTHRHLLAEFDTVSKLLDISAADKILGSAPFFHSYGLSNAVLVPILAGATLYIMGDFFPKDVAKLIEQERVTGFPGVPFMFQLLVDLRSSADFTSLRYAFSAGAPLPLATAQAFLSQYRVEIKQLYGSTETGVISFERQGVASAESTVGVPIPGVTVQIVDESNQPVPDGTEGQVSVVSSYAASTYDNQKEKSESYFSNEKFFPGDLGKISTRGQLILCGRKRQFINVAGNKVDPTEVENVLREYPAVSEAVVIGVPDGAASEKVKAVLVASPHCTRAEIIEHCKRLAEFKRPRVIDFRKEIPRSPLGKILRKYLIDEPNSGKTSSRFDPLAGFRLTTTAKPGANPGFDFATLPPILRLLLVTDGTVTKMLEAYLWEAIEVELLFHALIPSEQAYPEIGIKPGDVILLQKTVLRGKITGSAYAYAVTIMRSEHFRPDIVRDLVATKKGVGEMLRDQREATFSELVSIDQDSAGEAAGVLGVDPNPPAMTRHYRLSHGGAPTIKISEIFPIIRFEKLS